MKAHVFLFLVLVVMVSSSWGQSFHLSVSQNQTLDIKYSTWPRTISNWKWEITTGRGLDEDSYVRLFWQGISPNNPDESYIDHLYPPEDYFLQPIHQMVKGY